jgi:chromosome segregation ATPase
VADHFEEVIGLRVAALEARVAAEAESVKQHFAELQSFITFTVTTQVTQLKVEFKSDLRRVEQRLDGRIDGLERRFDGLEQRFDGLEQRFDRLDRKMDAHHDAMKLILGDILSRLPATQS